MPSEVSTTATSDRGLLKREDPGERVGRHISLAAECQIPEQTVALMDIDSKHFK